MMRVQALLLIGVAAMATTLPALAQGGAAQDHATLYIDAMALPKKASICAAHQSDFKQKFATAFADWRTTHKVALTSGEAYLRADAKAKNIPFPANIEMETDSVAQFLQMAEPAVIKERCAELLADLRSK